MHDDNISETRAQELADAAQSITQKIVSGLKEAAPKSDAAEPRLFFPNGIELIDVEIKVGLADVVVKIAGGEGIKGKVVQASKAMTTSRRYILDASECDDTDPLAGGRMIRWINFGNSDITIHFGSNGSPLDCNPGPCDHFLVPAHGGTVDTRLQSGLLPNSNYPFSNPPTNCPRAGMPRIIIQ